MANLSGRKLTGTTYITEYDHIPVVNGGEINPKLAWSVHGEDSIKAGLRKLRNPDSEPYYVRYFFVDIAGALFSDRVEKYENVEDLLEAIGKACDGTPDMLYVSTKDGRQYYLTKIDRYIRFWAHLGSFMEIGVGDSYRSFYEPTCTQFERIEQAVIERLATFEPSDR